MNIEPESEMRVALAKMVLFFPYVHSLKEKRRLINKVRQRIFDRFKINVHEVSHHDKWQRAELGFAVVGNDATLVQSVADKIFASIAETDIGQIVDSLIEVVTF